MNCKCIKSNEKVKCPMYHISDDVYQTCKLVPGAYIDRSCIGINKINPKMEEIICKIAKLTTELNTLEELENIIIDNQEYIKE